MPVKAPACLRSLAGPLPRPTLQALPSALVPLGSLVTLRCRGPPGVDLYRLEQLGTRRYSDQDVLVIPALDRSSVGRYRCSYQHGSRWSPASEVLELVAVGELEGWVAYIGRRGLEVPVWGWGGTHTSALVMS